MSVTASPPDIETTEATDSEPDPSAPSEAAQALAERVGGEAVPARGIDKVAVDSSRWVDTLTTARDDGLVFFSWLSAIDWAKEVAVGDAPSDDDLEERIELLCTVSDLSEGRMVTFSTVLDHDAPQIDSITGVYPGANWHEREAAEMFGISFDGHPSPGPLYLPDGFLGNPLRKSFRLLSREVKPWPGKVDVEAMPENDDSEADDGSPSTENPEA